MVFSLASGMRVRTFDLGAGQFEFVTRDSDGQVISTVRQSGAQAADTLAALEANTR